MLNLASALQPYDHAGAGNEHVPIWAWIDEQTFLTKDGEVGVVLKVDPVDYETLSPEARDLITNRLEQTLRSVRSPFRVLEYLFKRSGVEIPTTRRDDPVVQATVDARADFLRKQAHTFHTIDIYYVLLYTGSQHDTGFRSAFNRLLQSMGKDVESAKADRSRALADLLGMLSSKREKRLIRDEVNRARDLLTQATQTFALGLSAFTSCTVLRQLDASRMLMRLLNPDFDKTSSSPLPGTKHVDIWLNTGSIEDHGDHLVIDGYHVQLMSLREPSRRSRPLVFRKLAEIDGNFHIFIEWCGLQTEDAKAIVKKARNYFRGTAVSAVSAAFSNGAGPANSADTDESKISFLKETKEIGTELEVNGRVLGTIAMTILVYDKDPAIAGDVAKKIRRAFADIDASLIDETYAITNALYTTIPGNYKRNVRTIPMLDCNFADYSFLFSLAAGNQVNSHLQDEYLAALETNQRTLFWLNLHYYDIAHALLLGSTGMGKSFLLNFLVTCLMKYRPFMTIFGLGQDFAGLARIFKGSCFRVSLEGNTFRINPFSLANTAENREFLLKFVMLLLSNNDPNYSCSLDEQRELRKAIENIYALEGGLRTLSVFRTLIPKALSDNLDRWTNDGPYAALFDNAVDTLNDSDFQVLDFEGMEKHPEILNPLLMFFLHRATSILHDPRQSRRLKVFVMDEMWRLASHPIVCQYIIDILNLGRKKNAMMLMATHHIGQVAHSPLLRPLLDNCPTTLFLANDKLDRSFYKDTLGLHDGEIECIAKLQPKKQFFFRQNNIGKTLTLNVDPRSYWIYANNAPDNAKRDDAIAKYGFDKALDLLSVGAA